MKQSLILKSILLVFIAMVSFSGVCQSTITASNLSENWTLLTTKDGVEVYLKQEKCNVGADNLFTYAFVRLVNTNSIETSVEFDFHVKFDTGYAGSGDIKKTNHIISINASSSIEGDCTFGALSLLTHNPYLIEPGILESIDLVLLNIK